MSTIAALCLVLEFARKEQTDDPYAFRLEPQDYLLRGAGGSFMVSRLVWDESLLGDLAAVRRPGHDPAVPQRLGQRLRQFVLPLGWGELEAELRAATAGHRRVLLTIRSAAAELYALPWELLTLGDSGQHIGELEHVLIRYEWPGTVTVPALTSPAAPAAERILFAWSAAGGRVPVAAHLNAIRAACEHGVHPFAADRDVLPELTALRLSAVLTAAQSTGPPIAILHLLCHGVAVGSTFGMAWDDGESGGMAVLDGGRLRQLLSPHAGMLRLVVLCACDSGNSGTLGNQLGSIAQTLHRAGIAAVVASRYPLSFVDSVQLTATLYAELFGRLQPLEAALLAARRQLATDVAQGDWASLQFYARAADGDDTRPVMFRPFRGLLAFQPEHQRFFFGRRTELETIVTKLRDLQRAGRPRFVIVAGASGCGKSSLVLAGVAPALGRTLPAPRLVRLPIGDAAALAALQQAPGSSSAPVLVLIDQLEELFTHVSEPAAQKRWLRTLWQLASATSGGVSILCTLRVDFIGRGGELALTDAGLRLDTVAYDETFRVFLAQQAPAQLHEVITGPAQLVGLRLEEGLVERLLLDVADEPGALPLLEYTLDQLWLRRQGRTLTQAAYDAVGGIAGALQSRAEELLAELDPTEQRIARRIAVRLVQRGEDPAHATRRRVRVATLRPASGDDATRFDKVVAALVSARLLVCAGDGGNQTVELAHEALIRKWPRLRLWLDQDRELLDALSSLDQLVTQRREHHTLLTGDQLVYAEGIVSRYPQDCSPAVLSLVRDSQAHRWRRRLRLRATVALLTLTTCIAIGLAWFGQHSAQRARLAQRAAMQAQATALTAEQKEAAARKAIQEQLRRSYVEEGRRLLVERGDAVRALLWLNRAYQEDLDTPALRLLIAQARFQLASLRLTVSGRAPVWSPDGTTVLTRSGDTLKLWELASGRLRRTFDGTTGAFSPDGSRLVLSHAADHRGEVVDASSGESRFRFGGPLHPVDSVAFSGDGRQLLTTAKAGPDAAARWSATDGQLLRAFPPLGKSPNSDIEPVAGYAQVRLSADGRRLVSEGECPAVIWEAASGRRLWDSDHMNQARGCWSEYAAAADRLLLYWTVGPDVADVQVWDAVRGRHLSSAGANNDARLAVLSPDGQQLVTVPNSGGPLLWSLGAQDLRLPLGGQVAQPTTAQFSRDGSRVATGDSAGVIQLWDTRSGQLLQSLIGASSPTAFSPDGTLLAAEGTEQSVAIFSCTTSRTLPALAGARRSHVRAAAATSARAGARFRIEATADLARVYDTASGGLVWLLAHSGATAVHGFITPDSAFAVTWTAQWIGEGVTDEDALRPVAKSARLWDLQTGQLLLLLDGEAADLLVTALQQADCAVRTADGRCWELPTYRVDKSELAEFVRCALPLRFVGELLVPDLTRKCSAVR